MAIVVVLFDLKPGTDAAAYEQWARTTDLPTVNNLESVNKFSVFKATGLMGGGKSPYQYLEILDLQSLEQLRAEARSDIMRKVAAEFREFADTPLFIITEPVE